MYKVSPACSGVFLKVQYPQKSRHMWVRGMNTLGENVIVLPLPRSLSADAASHIPSSCSGSADTRAHASSSVNRSPAASLTDHFRDRAEGVPPEENSVVEIEWTVELISPNPASEVEAGIKAPQGTPPRAIIVDASRAAGQPTTAPGQGLFILRRGRRLS